MNHAILAEEITIRPVQKIFHGRLFMKNVKTLGIVNERDFLLFLWLFLGNRLASFLKKRIEKQRNHLS